MTGKRLREHREPRFTASRRRRFRFGDRMQFTAPNPELEIANREFGRVEGIAQGHTMRLKLDSGRSVHCDPQRFPHLGHGYAVTSYSESGTDGGTSIPSPTHRLEQVIGLGPGI